MSCQCASIFESLVTRWTGVGEALDVNLHVGDQILLGLHSGFSTKAAGVNPVLSSDNVLREFLIYFLQVGKVLSFGVN